MKTVFEHIRTRLLRPVELHFNGDRIPTYQELLESENHREVWDLCDNRTLMAAFRYGSLEERRKEYERNGRTDYDMVNASKLRVGFYDKTGNLEHILDAINLLALEFRFPSHPNAHFEPVDDGVHVEKRED